MKIMFLPNGKVLLFEGSEQLPLLHTSWLSLYLRDLSEDIDLDGMEVVLPDVTKYTIRETKDRFILEVCNEKS